MTVHGTITSSVVSTHPEALNPRLGCTCLTHACCGAAAGPGATPATPQVLKFLKTAGAIHKLAMLGALVSVDMAVSACGKAGVAVPVMAALAGVPKLKPYTAPLAQTQPLLAPSGAMLPSTEVRSSPVLWDLRCKNSCTCPACYLGGKSFLRLCHLSLPLRSSIAPGACRCRSSWIRCCWSGTEGTQWCWRGCGIDRGAGFAEWRSTASSAAA